VRQHAATRLGTNRSAGPVPRIRGLTCPYRVARPAYASRTALMIAALGRGRPHSHALRHRRPRLTSCRAPRSAPHRLSATNLRTCCVRTRGTHRASSAFTATLMRPRSCRSPYDDLASFLPQLPPRPPPASAHRPGASSPHRLPPRVTHWRSDGREHQDRDPAPRRTALPLHSRLKRPTH